MLFEGLDNLKRTSLMTIIIFVFLGNLLLVMPESYIPLLSHALGFCLLVILALTIFGFLSSSRALINYLKLSLGLIAGITGVMLFAFDDVFVSALSWLVGTIPILLGAFGIYQALVFARRSGRRGWWVLIILSVALMCFGGVVFWNPWMDDAQGMLRVIGGTLMFSAVACAISLIWVWPTRTSQA